MRICVYGAASNRIDPAYIRAAEELGEAMAKRGHGLVFGGGASGMMGGVARGVSRHGGEIIGVAPTFFQVDGVLYPHCTTFLPTETMRERKALMEETADAFVITPGGIGTWEEFFEVLTLKQLGRHNKPIAVYNLQGYYDPMHRMLQEAVAQDFVRQENFTLCPFFTGLAPMLAYLEAPPPPEGPVPLYREGAGEETQI